MNGPALARPVKPPKPPVMLRTPRGPSWHVRMRVRLRRHELDRDIARGAAVTSSPAMAVRARELSSEHGRREIADSLANILEAVVEDPECHLTRDRVAVAAAYRDVLTLIALLCSDLELDVRGIARARLLIDNRTSPLFRAVPGKTLGQALAEIRDAL